MIYCKKSPFIELQVKIPSQKSLPVILVMDQKHPTQTTHLNLLTQNFTFFPNQCGAAQTVQWLCYTLEDQGFKSSQKQQTYLFSKTSKPAPAPTQSPTPAFSLAVKWPVQSDHSHLSKAKFKNQWSFTSTPPVCHHVTYWYNLILSLLPTYVHISQQVTSFLVL